MKYFPTLKVNLEPDDRGTELAVICEIAAKR